MTGGSGATTARPAGRDRWRRPWWIAAGALLVLVVVVGMAQVLTADARPGAAWTVATGVAAAACLLVALLYGARRRLQRLATRRRYGPAAAWLEVHVVTGSFFLLLLLLHAGPTPPRGVLTTLLWACSLWVVLGGLAGIVLQRWIPRSLAALSTEVLYERIPELVESIHARGEALAAEAAPSVRSLWERRLGEELARPRRRIRFLFDITGGSARQLEELDYLRPFLEDDDRRAVDELAELLRTKTDLDAHFTLQPALRWWLALHLPPSFALAGLVLVHVLAVSLY